MKKFSYIEIILALSFLLCRGVLYSFSQESTLQETKKNIIATEKRRFIGDWLISKKGGKAKS